jgi:hypothetical protein
MGSIFKRLCKKPKVFSRITGISVEEFNEIVKKARPVWHKKVEKPKKVAGRPYGLESLEGHILCLLIYYRTYLTQEFLGFLFNIDDSCVSRSIRRASRVLAPVLGIEKRRLVPEQEAKDLLIDCTEHPIERPRKNQGKYYSGKKKRHTLKTEIQMTTDGKIIHISNPYEGKIHDMNIRKQGPPLHPDDTAYVDSGYQGLQQDHANTEYPYKRSKNKPLSSDEKEYNRALSRVRVKVEHKIRQLKIFRILKEQYRNRRKGFGIAVNIVAGIVNMKSGF